MTVNYSDFIKYRDALEKLRAEKAMVELAIIKNPFEELIAYLHDTYCGCMELHQNCNECNAGSWEEGTSVLLEQMTTILSGFVSISSPIKKGRSRKLQIED